MRIKSTDRENYDQNYLGMKREHNMNGKNDNRQAVTPKGSRGTKDYGFLWQNVKVYLHFWVLNKQVGSRSV